MSIIRFTTLKAISFKAIFIKVSLETSTTVISSTTTSIYTVCLVLIILV